MSSHIDAFATTNARYSVLSWEPVPLSGERLNVAAIAEFNGKPVIKTLIRGEVLRCMYGDAADGVLEMISSIVGGLNDALIAEGWEEALQAVPFENFSLMPSEDSFATSEEDLFRQIVLTHCSLSVLADEGSHVSEDAPAADREVSQKWATQIRQAIQIRRPDLSIYFNREAVLIDNGLPVRFGILSPNLAAHFGLLRITAQAAGMKEARAKLWELSLAKERNSGIRAALIFGTPPQDDVTISDRQRNHLVANMHELTCEAISKNINLKAVQSADSAAEAVVELA